MAEINETHPFQVLLWVSGIDNPKSILEKGRWVEWARCTSRVKANDVAVCLSIRNPTGVQTAELISHGTSARWVGYKYYPESARELGVELPPLQNVEPAIQALLSKLPEHYPQGSLTHDERGYMLKIGLDVIFHSKPASEALERTRRYVAERERQPNLPIGVIDGLYD